MKYLLAFLRTNWFRFRLFLAIYRAEKKIAALERSRVKLVKTGLFKWQALLQIDKDIDKLLMELDRYSFYHAQNF